MHKKKSRFTVRPAGRPNSDINVTPLVDVVLVLLIIFMVVTPLLEKMIRVRVPDAEQNEQQDTPPQAQLVVSVGEDGAIAINSEKVADDAYVARLKRVLAAKAPGDRLVFFSADDKAKYARLVTALDGARQAGAEILTMTTEPMAPAAGAAEGAAPTATP
ncbi:MAG TPA: biopolymer transporter ExbD [Anaeromyxobacter sp.]|nr:biopolymer transporter ExbD [Anaeromyxobacter sp.]